MRIVYVAPASSIRTFPFLGYCGGIDPPHVTVAWQRVYSSVLAAALSSSFKHLTHRRGRVMQRSRLSFPRFTGFLGPVWSVPWYSLSHVVLPSLRSSVRCRPTLAALRRPAGQAFPLHASLRLSYRPIPTSSAPSDIPHVHSISTLLSLIGLFLGMQPN